LAVPGTITPTFSYLDRIKFTISSTTSANPPGVSIIISIELPVRLLIWSLNGSMSE